MADWRAVLPESDLTADGIHGADVGGTRVILMRVTSGVVAYRDACPHEGFPLSEVGEREGDLLICSKHLWEFECCTGRHVSRLERPQCNLIHYPTRIEGGMIEVDVGGAAST